jgi:site-specific DNA recombinase
MPPMVLMSRPHLIAEIDANIAAQTSDEGRQAHLRSVRSRLTEISSQVQNQLSDADWTTKREIIRALVQRIEMAQRDSQLSFVCQPMLARVPSIQLW